MYDHHDDASPVQYWSNLDLRRGVSGNYITNADGYDPLVVSLGVQAGVHNLLGLFGVRSTLELSAYSNFALADSLADCTNAHLTEVISDALFSSSCSASPGTPVSAAGSGGLTMLVPFRLERSSWPGCSSRRCRPSGCRPARAPCSTICEPGRDATFASRPITGRASQIGVRSSLKRLWLLR